MSTAENNKKHVFDDGLLDIRGLFEAITKDFDAICCSIVNRKFAYISQSVKILLGYDPVELLGKSAETIVYEGDLPYVREVGERIFAGEGKSKYTCRFRCKSGNYRWYETSVHIIRDGSGTVSQIIGVSRDISEQMDLQESLEQAVHIARLGHWERDLRTDRLTFSKEMCTILDLPPGRQELLFEAYRRYVHPEDREMLERRIQQSIEMGHPLQHAYRIIRMNGSIRYLYSQAEVVLNEAGVPVRLIGTAQDITEQKFLMMQLRESEDRYRRLVDNSLDAICVFENGKWVFMNHVGLEMFGATSEHEILGQDYLDFLDPSHHEDSQNRLKAILSNEQVKPVEYKWMRRNGEAFYAEVIGSPFGENGVQMCIRDITDRKRTDELLLRSEKLTAVGQLAAGVAHEIKNPLTSLKGFTKMLHEKSRGQNRRYIEIMKSELERIELILSEMLVLAKPQTLKFEPQHVDLILQEIVTLLSTHAVMNNVLIDIDREGNIPVVSGDKAQLKQVFINLMKNGIESMPGGGNLLIRVRTEDLKIEIDIIDEGEGIPQERIPKLGEPFYTTKEGGTGLGLMLCHKIIADHRGNIEISSKVGEGTKVTIGLPIGT